mgnify:FL=1
MSGPTGKPAACDGCGWPTARLAYRRRPDDDAGGAWLCRVCAGTAAGGAALSPANYGDLGPVLATLAWGVNYLADLIAV